MKLFDCPKIETWNSRREWLDRELGSAETGLSYLVSDHSTALFMDMNVAFCAGDRISVIVMSISVIDSHLRETESGDNSIGIAQLLQDFYGGEEIDWLRKLRNRYVYHNLEKSILDKNAWFRQIELERDVFKTMKMTTAALFQNPGI